MESTRQQKVGRLLQKELGAYFQQHGKEIAPGKMITVTVVRISPDLGFAKVYLSIFPSTETEIVLKSIKSRESSIRRDIGNKIKNQLRSIPEFSYLQDDSLDYIDNIDNLLK
jgi:ribosome-binding factor A